MEYECCLQSEADGKKEKKVKVRQKEKTDFEIIRRAAIDNDVVTLKVPDSIK